MMIARQVFRSVQPLKHSVRRYATDSPSSGGGNSFYIVGAVAALAAGGGYYYSQNGLSKSSQPTAAPLKTKDDSDPQNQGKPGNSTFLGGDQGWLDLKLESVEELSHNTKKFRFALPDKDDVSGLHVASALLTKFKGPEMDKPVIRPYTPTSDEDARGHIDFVVKKYPDGPMSSHMHGMKPDQRLDFKGPIAKYAWQPNKHDHIALIAGGTGITPMYQLCRAIFQNPSDTTKVTLVFGNVSEPDILLKNELQDLENTYPQRFKAFYLLDQPPDSWTQGKGFISQEVLKQVLPEPKEENIKIFVCGPPGLYKAISGVKTSPSDQGELDGILKKMGYIKEQVYKF